ncbi:unnamed protein product [Sphacelaria rigidula]
MDSGVMVSLSMSVRGLLPWASMSDESGKDTASRSLFKKGMGMRVLVRNVDKEQHRLIFTLKGVRQSLPPAPGDVVRGEVLLSVKQWLAPSLMVSLDGGGIGRVCVTELADKSKWKNDPLSK